ncbi:hypothetical protein KC330_g188 [Hortaea werneckii]|nr:hypothetical protein KC330_g188 [Hortaea werneckii]
MTEQTKVKGKMTFKAPKRSASQHVEPVAGVGADVEEGEVQSPEEHERRDTVQHVGQLAKRAPLDQGPASSRRQPRAVESYRHREPRAPMPRTRERFLRKQMPCERTSCQYLLTIAQLLNKKRVLSSKLTQKLHRRPRNIHRSKQSRIHRAARELRLETPEARREAERAEDGQVQHRGLRPGEPAAVGRWARVGRHVVVVLFFIIRLLYPVVSGRWPGVNLVVLLAHSPRCLFRLLLNLPCMAFFFHSVLLKTNTDVYRLVKEGILLKESRYDLSMMPLGQTISREVPTILLKPSMIST